MKLVWDPKVGSQLEPLNSRFSLETKVGVSNSTGPCGFISTKLTLVLKLVLFWIPGTLVLSGEPICVSTNFEQNYRDQRCIINRGSTQGPGELNTPTAVPKKNLLFLGSCWELTSWILSQFNCGGNAQNG